MSRVPYFNSLFSLQYVIEEVDENHSFFQTVRKNRAEYFVGITAIVCNETTG
jgi:hypothetical protein